VSESRAEPHPARQLFAAAEELAPSPSRETLLSRLSQYRQAAFVGLSSLAPRQELHTWSSLLVGLPPLPEGAAAVLASTTDDAVLDDDALGLAVVHARAGAGEVLRLIEALAQARNLEAHRRVVRGANGFVLSLAVMALIATGASKAMAPADLAKGKPWRASSKMFDCHPEQIDCGGARTAIFFHTVMEKEPWVEIDLGTPTRFSAVTVRNRSDAARERAVPLVLEVGDDARTWRTLAERAVEFRVWKAKFEPITARYVRLRAKNQTYLHLDAVQVHP